MLANTRSIGDFVSNPKKCRFCEHRGESRGHDVDRLQPIDSTEQSLCPVVLRNRGGLSAINLQPGPENLGVIVFAYALAVLCRFLGATSDTIEKRIFVDLKL